MLRETSLARMNATAVRRRVAVFCHDREDLRNTLDRAVERTDVARWKLALARAAGEPDDRPARALLKAQRIERFAERTLREHIASHRCYD